MRVLACHNYYQQPGGEDESFEHEAALLESHGDSVIRYTLHNDAIRQMSSVGVACRTLWNRQSYPSLRELIRREKPDVMHCTNTFPLISPSAYYAAAREGVPVVQSLRNYRLLCPKASFVRDGRICELCLGKSVPWPAVVHACYRNSRPASATVVAMLSVHRMIKTWTRQVDAYYALTEFSRKKFIEGGFAAEKIMVKPNLVFPDPGVGRGDGGYVVYVGRLAPEKGIDTLLAAWAALEAPIPLKIIGDGPLAPQVRAAAEKDPRITWLGHRGQEDVLAILGAVLCLVIPSIWYECFPRTIVEAYSKGTPVLASSLGSMIELIDHGRTGLKFEPGNPADLAARLTQLWDNPTLQASMRLAARREHDLRYDAESNYRTLMEIYDRAAANRVQRAGDPEAADPELTWNRP